MHKILCRTCFYFDGTNQPQLQCPCTEEEQACITCCFIIIYAKPQKIVWLVEYLEENADTSLVHE